jgi:hypothetical protein
MLRFAPRFFFLLLLVLVFSTLAHADSFQIMFTGTASGSGQFTTNGTCSMCFPTSGLLTWIVDIGPDSGPNAFDITDDGPATNSITYDRMTNTFSSIGTFNSENNDFFILFSNGAWQLSSLSGDFSGTYSVTPAGVPEPSSFVLLLLGVIGCAAVWSKNSNELK